MEGVLVFYSIAIERKTNKSRRTEYIFNKIFILPLLSLEICLNNFVCQVDNDVMTRQAWAVLTDKLDKLTVRFQHSLITYPDRKRKREREIWNKYSWRHGVHASHSEGRFHRFLIHTLSPATSGVKQKLNTHPVKAATNVYLQGYWQSLYQ